MYIKLVSMFALGATVGYTAHRPSDAAGATSASVAEARPAPAAAAPAVIVVQAPAPSRVNAPPQLPIPDVETVQDAGVPDAEPDADPNTEPAPHGSIQGTVTDGRSGRPVYRVQIRAESRGGDELVTYSDEDGTYRIEGLASATYTVHFQRYAELPTQNIVGVGQLDATTLDVVMQPDPAYY